MADAPSLDPRRELFCSLVADGTSFAAAARMAGYAPRSARERGSELMARDDVRRRVDELKAERTAAHAARFDRIEAWLVRLVERGFELDQLAIALRGLDRLMQLHAPPRLPAVDREPEPEEDPAVELLAAALLADAAVPAAAAAAGPVPAAPVLNRRARRALRALRRP